MEKFYFFEIFAKSVRRHQDNIKKKTNRGNRTHSSWFPFTYNIESVFTSEDNAPQQLSSSLFLGVHKKYASIHR